MLTSVNHSVQNILNHTIMQRIECVFCCIVFTHKEFMKWFRPVIFCHLWSWIIKFYRQILKVLRSPWKMNTFLEDTLQFEWHFLTPKGLSFHLNSEVMTWIEHILLTTFFRKICIDKRLCMYKLQERQLFHTCYFCILIPIIN